jgi:conjugative relaxase-like TrwC/TraI family protein
MVTIGKLGKGQQTYYLDTVAGGADDYYAGEGEAPGRWVGVGAAELELQGRVERDQLTAVLNARDPRSGEQLPRRLWKRRTPGFDVTFSAPKSVSVLWATADKETATAIRDAHERSVEAALAYLEREAAFSRAGVERVPTQGSGFVGAAFRHRMSRAGDPQLHTHVLVANLTRSKSGEWRALDGQRLYRRAKTAGYLYQAHLREELGRELGVGFREVHRGAAEIAGIPDEALLGFSQRRQEIKARMGERGEDSRRAAEMATLATRKTKNYGIARGDQRAEWRRRAGEMGLKPAAALGRAQPRAQTLDRRRLYARVEAALSAEQTAFARRHVVEQIAAAHRQGAPVKRVEELTDRFLARAQVVELGEARPAGASPSAASEPLYTTRELLALEERLADTAQRQAGRRLAVAERPKVEAALARDQALVPEQRELVRRLALDGDGTVCVMGRAGTGKTRALRSVREAFEASGVVVIGASTQNTAARILEQEAGIRSTSLTRLLYEADVEGFGLPRGGVVVVDEAGMASTRALARLQEVATRNSAKLVLIGDPAQLPAIEHPGGFRGLIDRLKPLELREVRRLRDPTERAAVELVRSGWGSSALAAYQERGQLTLAETIPDLETMVAADRHAAHQEGEDAVVLVRTRARAGRLNELAQGLRIADGELGAEELQVGESRIREGDYVVTRVNRGGEVPVYNRERWTVEAIDANTRAMTLRHRVEAGRVVTLDADYLDRARVDAAGSVELGYAITKYGAQGMTVDRGFAVLSDGLSKEDAYTALTRAREGTELYAVAREPVEHAEIAPVEEERELGSADLARQMERSEQRALAIDERLRAELERKPTGDLLEAVRRIETAGSGAGRRRTEALAAARADAERALERAVATLAERGPGEHGERARLEAVREHAAERLRELRAREEAAREATPAVSQTERERGAAIERVLAERRHLRTEATIHLGPAYLTDALGPRPEGLRRRLEWEHAVDQVERHRQRLGVRDPERALGREPHAAFERAEWRRAQRQLDALRARLAERQVSRERVLRPVGIER